MKPVLLATAIALFAGPASAEILGFGRLFTNDAIGDGHDRWRTGSSMWSLVTGPEWTGLYPQAVGTILEYRLQTQIVVPYRADGVRPYVGMVSLGVHAPFGSDGVEGSFGVDVTAIGPQTRLSDFQERFHEAFSLSAPPGAEDQLGDALYLGAVAEIAYPLRVTETATLRPFAELRIGVEDMARIGADVALGRIGQADLVTRDTVSGQLIRAVEGPGSGPIWVAGADVARVGASVLLPADRGVAPRDLRWRARTGLHWQFGAGASAFYGMTWLGPEFVGQDEGQVVGGVRLNFNY